MNARNVLSFRKTSWFIFKAIFDPSQGEFKFINDCNVVNGLKSDVK